MQLVATSPSKKKNKKKKGKKAQKGQVTDTSKSTSPSSGSKKADVGDMTLEELDQLLRKESRGKTRKITDAPAANESVSAALRQVLSVESKYLDADAEMKRMFGSKVVNKEMRERSHGR